MERVIFRRIDFKLRRGLSFGLCKGENDENTAILLHFKQQWHSQTLHADTFDEFIYNFTGYPEPSTAIVFVMIAWATLKI